MFRQLLYKFAGKRGHRILLVLGLCLTALAMYKLVRTAMYVQECVVVTAVVTDVIQKPFESTAEALENGNFALGGSTSYSAIVRYTVPGGLVIDRMMTDADDTDYSIGQQVAVITPALDPSQAHIYKWKFIWGWECMQLGTGVLMTLLGLALKEREPQSPGKQPVRKTAVRKKKAEASTPRKRAPRKKKQG